MKKKAKIQALLGFTLIELIIATAIFSIVMVTIYTAFHTGVFGYRNIEEAMNACQSAKQALEQINLDLRNSLAYSENEVRFTGNKNEVSFFALVDTFLDDEAIQEYAFVSYKQQGSMLLRLCRKNEDSLNNNSETKPEEMDDNIGKIDFSYGRLDIESREIRWEDSWEDPKALPVAVKVKLGLKNKRKNSFERTIFL